LAKAGSTRLAGCTAQGTFVPSRETSPLEPKEPFMANIQQKPNIEDDPSVLEIYGNKLVSTSFDRGAVVITMGTARIFLNESTRCRSRDNRPSFM
jgi:hypothetical protein